MIVHTLESKTNFVDGNNVLVGFDTVQDCCENARWWISETGKEADALATFDIKDYFFDPEFVNNERNQEADDGKEEYWIAFRLVAQDQPPLFLTLANAHNGYYGHGFNVDIGGKTIWGGVL